MTDSDLVTDGEFAKLRLELQPHAADSWLRVPWHISLAQAVRVAARENKPLAMIVRSGHPLGCTCNNGLVDRGIITENPEIADLLATRYVPVAIDQHIHRRLDSAEGRLFDEVVKRARLAPGATVQGFYVFTSSGEVLAYRHTHDPAVVRQMLLSALENPPSPSSSSAWIDDFEDASFALKTPPGVVVLDVTSKVLDGYGDPESHRQKILQTSQGRDHCWILNDEVLSLSQRIVPDSLLIRMARFHLVDNTRGEPPMWRADQVRSAEAILRDGRLFGSVKIQTARGRRGYEASLFGVVETEGKVLTRFDVVAQGLAWGRGYFNGGAPAGRYPLAVRFTMAEGVWPFDAVPPGAARTRSTEYLGMPVAWGSGK